MTDLQPNRVARINFLFDDDELPRFDLINDPLVNIFLDDPPAEFFSQQSQFGVRVTFT